MIWRATVLMLASFAAAGLAVWFAPALFDLMGLGEFGFLGQLGLAVLALSVLDAIFRRLPGSHAVEEP